MTLSQAWSLPFAIACGALLTLSLAPFDIWPAGLISLGGLFFLLLTSAGGWRTGFAYGLGKFGAGVSWIYFSIHDYGGAPPLLAAFLVALFVVTMAVLMALPLGVLFARFKRSSLAYNTVLFATLWLAFEWLYTWFLTGFPWLYAGYAHLNTPLAGLAPTGGVLLIGFAVALTGAAAVGAGLSLARPGGRRLAGGYVLAAALPWLVGAALDRVTWSSPTDRARVVLVQGNIEQAVKWLPENRVPIVRKYVELTEPHWDADLIVWPESAITLFEEQATELLAAWDARGSASGAAFVLGLPALARNADDEVVFNNAVRAMGAGSGKYVKRRLVPFGEYVPLEDLIRGAITFFDLPMSHAEPGPWQQPLLQLGTRRASMAICYEVVYPDLVRDHNGAADVLLTVTNDSWFGTSIGPLQHLQMVQMRALENGRWMLRGTNNGVTAIVDHRGRIVDRLPQFETGVLTGSFEYRTGRTPYVVTGDWPALTGAAMLLIGIWWLGKRRGW